MQGSVNRKALCLKGNEYDMIKNYVNMIAQDIRKHHSAHLGDGTNSDPPNNKILIFLGPANNLEHQEMFCKNKC